jgi:hypothetical protein
MLAVMQSFYHARRLRRRQSEIQSPVRTLAELAPGFPIALLARSVGNDSEAEMPQ